MYLYLITTAEGWTFYAIADSHKSAEALVNKLRLLNKKEVVRIEKLAQTYQAAQKANNYLPLLLKAEEENE